jgi:hypothetical protein
MSGVTEPTTTRIRDGYSARRETINKLLKGFSEVYGVELSLDNVTGITLEDKKAIRKQMLERNGLTEKAEKQPVIEKTVKDKEDTEKAEKRTYSRKQDSNLPDGCILATEFATLHGVKRETFRDHMLIGKGPGTVPGQETHPTMGVKDHVDYSERQKPNRPAEKEKFLDSPQQYGALLFWKRNKVGFTECDRADCRCHGMKEENN